MEWRVMKSRAHNSSGGYLVVCSKDEKKLQHAVCAIKEELDRSDTKENETELRDIAKLQGNTDKTSEVGKSSEFPQFSRKLSPEGQDSNSYDSSRHRGRAPGSPEQQNGYRDHHGENDQFEVYDELKAVLPSSVVRHLSKQNLEKFLNSLKQTAVSIEDIGESYHLKVPYNKRGELASVLDEHLGNYDRSLDYLREIDPQSAKLLRLYCQKSTRISCKSLNYNETEQEIEVKLQNDCYTELKEAAETLKHYQTDTVDVSQAKVSVSRTLKDFMDNADPKFTNILVEAVYNDQAINIYYPVEEQEKAFEVKNRLQIQLELIKVTKGRRGRRFNEDYTSLQPTVPPETEEKKLTMAKAKNSQLIPEKSHGDKQYKTMLASTSSYKRSISMPSSNQTTSDFRHPATKPERGLSEAVYCSKQNLLIKVYKGDVKKLDVDCIVNAANDSLFHGAGIAAVIAAAAARDFDKECRRYIHDNGPLDVSQCISTGAGRLPYDYVLHAVGPQWGMYNDKEDCKYDLMMTIVNILRRAEVLKMKSVAIPSISSGIFGVPWDVCAEQYARGVNEFEEDSQQVVREVHFIDINEKILQQIRETFAIYFKVQTSDEADLSDI